MPPTLDKPTSWRRSDAKPTRHELTAEEQTNVRAALRVLRTRFDGTRALSEALGVTFSRLTWVMSKNGHPGAALALYAARLASVPVEDVITGAFPKPGACALCGRSTEGGAS
jgi:hypothetical protein